MAGPNIGFVGLGAMGGGMARSLLRAGLTVVACDVSAEARDAFTADGGQTAETAAKAAAGADLLLAVVATAEQVRRLLFGDDGAVGHLPSGATVCLHATVAPDDTRAIAAQLAASGHYLLDAPISGGAARAASGDLLVMASGSAPAFVAAEPALQAMASTVHRLGDEPGIGSTVKMINQLLAGVHIATAAEAIAMGTRAGADPQVLYDVLADAAGGSWMFQNRVPHMLSGDYTPLSAVDIFVKDLGIVLDQGRALRFPLPLAAAAHQQFLAAAAAGHGRDDDAAVVKVYERLAGIDVAKAAGGDD